MVEQLLTGSEVGFESSLADSKAMVFVFSFCHVLERVYSWVSG